MKKKITDVRFFINEGMVSMVDFKTIYSSVCVNYKVNGRLDGAYIGIFKEKLTAKDVVEAVNTLLENMEKRGCLNGRA